MLRARHLLLGLFALLVPACSGDRFVAPPLFQETFAGSFPGSDWTAVSGSASATPSGSVGNPAPALNFKASGATQAASTTTIPKFANPNVTFIVQESVTTASAGLKGTGTISIVDSSNVVQASVMWDPEAGQLTYTFLGVAVAPMPAPAADGTFHVFRFIVDGTGRAAWSLDGVEKVFNTGFPAGDLNLRLSATFGTGTSWPEFNFDTITVTSP